MTGEIKYGDVALGVESALPAVTLPDGRRKTRYRRIRRLFSLMVAALKRWA